MKRNFRSSKSYFRTLPTEEYDVIEVLPKKFLKGNIPIYLMWIEEHESAFVSSRPITLQNVERGLQDLYEIDDPASSRIYKQLFKSILTKAEHLLNTGRNFEFYFRDIATSEADVVQVLPEKLLNGRNPVYIVDILDYQVAYMSSEPITFQTLERDLWNLSDPDDRQWVENILTEARDIGVE